MFTRYLHRTAAAAAASCGATVLFADASRPPPPAAAPPPPSPPAPQRDAFSGISPSLAALVGHTPVVELRSLSIATGCTILAKCEHLNPGLSIKDRAAAAIIADAEASGKLVPLRDRDAAGAWRARGGGDTIVEGTGGNTGVALALLGASRGYKVLLTMPDYIAVEKVELARALGAEVILCPPVPFSDPRHFYQVAFALGAKPGNVFSNQFEGLVNRNAHFTGTGPELWAQAGGRLDAFVCAAGTGGTLAGIGAYLRSVHPSVRLFLADPPSSSLASWVRTGKLAPSPGSTLVEGIGIGRLTANMASAPHIDGVIDVSDQEAWYLLRHEGIHVGPSAALNVVAAVKAARTLGPGHVVATVLCDAGARYGTKAFSSAWLREKGVKLSPSVFEARDHADFVS